MKMLLLGAHRILTFLRLRQVLVLLPVFGLNLRNA